MTADPAPADTTIVHLVRHGKVENPRGIIYGRLPGYHLSEDGRIMAKAAADFLAARDVTVLRSSPLDRALETAEPIAEQFGLEVEVDDALIESWNHFEGMCVGVGDGSLRAPRHWIYLRNPFAATADAARAARGHEAVCVSHQLPIWVSRRAAEGVRLWHDPRRRQCALGSVTSFTYHGDVLAGVTYAEPSAEPFDEDRQVAGA